MYKSIYLKLDLSDNLYSNAKIHPDLLEIYKEFLDAMNTDFNTPNAITAMQKLVKLGNQMLRNKTEPDVLLSVIKMFDNFFEVFGLKMDNSPLAKEDKEIYLLWEKARKEKDFASADKYRNILQEKGIV